MKKEDIILKTGDKVYYTNIFGKNKILFISGFNGSTIKEFEEDGSKTIKVERPTNYETIYEAPKPILDKEEKAYLEAVIRPFRNKSVTIKKVQLRAEEKEYLYIFLGNDDILLPSFIKNTMYKGMKPSKRYTLEELGLFEGE